MTRRRAVVLVAWALAAAPAIYQLSLLFQAIAGRLAYPYDLEWMEGGLLHHAERIADGAGIYAPPSIEFIPYLYTPLYPGLLAVLGKVFGLGYGLGRVVSVLALAGIAAVAWASMVGTARRAARTGGPDVVGPALAGWLGALGVFAAAYPYVEGWYDLVRADTLALLMVTGGVYAATRWRTARAAVALGVLMALAFFTKQTAILYVAWAGVLLLGASLVAARPRGVRALLGAAIPALAYGAAAGVLGLGGCALLQARTGGWFWTYVFEIHQAHDFNMDRFWRSFGNVLWHRPALTLLIGGTLLVVVVTSARRRQVPTAARPFLLWTATYALSTVVGAIGWGTEFAHFNAYMPALLHGALAVGAAVPALAAIAHGEPRPWLRVAAPALATGVLGVTLVGATWSPAKFTPTDADRRAGAALVADLRAVDGEVWVPYHPWYARLAGKRPMVHRMGLRDVTARSRRTVAGLDEAARTQRFAAIIFDNRPAFDDLPQFARAYRPERALTSGRPRVYTGARVVPEALWVPNRAEPVPDGVTVLFDFEDGWGDWELRGAAWGRAPATRANPGQSQPRGYRGRAFATSSHGGDKATGTARSPAFELDGATLSLRLGGGTDATKLRVELRVGDETVRASGVPGVASEDLRELSWDVTPWRGRRAHLALVDDATATWGHLTVDEVWLHQ